MSYLEQLRQSRDKSSVAFQEFALSTSGFSNYLFCFFEGKDGSYYVPRIKQVTDKIKPINCGGKEKVLKVYELIKNKSEYDKYKKAFFIDRDFDKAIENNDLIFETPCYSIENFYVNENSFRDILIHEFQLSENNDDSFQLALNIFRDRFNEFLHSVRLFNAWYSCLIDIRNSSNVSIGIQLEDKLPKGFINISLQNISQNYDIAKIKSIFPNSLNIDPNILNSKVSEFEKCDSENVFRGKYQMEFLITIIQLIIEDSKHSKTIFKNKINFSFDGALNNERALNVFTSYAKTPETLIDFLKKAIT